MIKTYLSAIVAGLYELHARGVVRSEGESMLSSLRTSADQAVQFVDKQLIDEPVQVLPDALTTALASIASDVAQLKDALLTPAEQGAPATGAEG